MGAVGQVCQTQGAAVGWERRRSRMVFVRSIRVGRRVRHVYCGCGPRAEAAAAADARRRAVREAAADARRRLRGEWAEATAHLRRLAAGTDRLLAAAMA